MTSSPPNRSRRRLAMALLGIIASMSWVLSTMGRRFWCQCGRPVPWSWDIRTQHNSQHLIDPYFFTHVLHGVIFAGVLIGLVECIGRRKRFALDRPGDFASEQEIASASSSRTDEFRSIRTPWRSREWCLGVGIAIEAVWEIAENSPVIINRYREATMALGYTGDSIANSITDVLACGLGFLFANRFGWRWSLALFVTVELALLATIRDCLILNVVMLIWPIEGIQHWQLNHA